MYAIYFAKSIKNDKVYVGKTTKDPSSRVYEHNHGSNEWSKLNGPFELVYYEKYHCKEDADAREKFYKSGFGRKIKQIILTELENTQFGPLA